MFTVPPALYAKQASCNNPFSELIRLTPSKKKKPLLFSLLRFLIPWKISELLQRVLAMLFCGTFYGSSYFLCPQPHLKLQSRLLHQLPALSITNWPRASSRRCLNNQQPSLNPQSPNKKASDIISEQMNPHPYTNHACFRDSWTCFFY